MAEILYGSTIRDAAIPELKREIAALDDKLTLAIIQVGDRADSSSYVRMKVKLGNELGVTVNHLKFPESVTQSTLLSTIKNLNADPDVHGIILQLPVPLTLDKDELIDSIAPEKDVDGMSAVNVKRLGEDREDAVMPATTRGVLDLLDHYGVEMAGKKVAVVGRSNLVGKPTAMAMLNRHATVTVCHSKTADLPAETRAADIVVVAVGVPGLITRDYVRPGQVVIDVGITSVTDNAQLLPKLRGDVVYSEVKDIVEAITPVPGGVGPMTVLSLFRNLLDVYRRHHTS